MAKHIFGNEFHRNELETPQLAEEMSWAGRARERVICRAAFAMALVLGLLAFATIVAARPATATADEDNSDVSLSPYFEVKGADPLVDALPLKSTQVDAVLAGVIAEVRVVQTYQNEGKTPLEARYIFPASTRAAVHGMTMTVGERRIEAQIKEKGEARKTYEAAKREGKTASLLEAHRSNVFEMNVANILPGDTVTVELRYNELIIPDDAEYEWVFPTVVGPRYTRATPPSAETEKSGLPNELTGKKRLGGEGLPYIREGDESSDKEPVFTMNIDIISGSPIRKVTCKTHKIQSSEIAGGVHLTLPPDRNIVMNRDFILRYKLAGDAIASGLMIDEYKGEKYFLLTVQPPARVEKTQVPPRDYVFVMDVSGSMWGFPLDVSKALLKEMLMNLRDVDTFNVLLFSGSNRTLFEKSIAATPENVAAAIALFEKGQKYQDYGGSTELLPALKRALALPATTEHTSRSIVVITDGYVDVEAEAYALVKQNLGEANLFAFGIGAGVNRELMERLARAGRSEAVIIEDEKRAKAGAEKFRKMIEAPVLTHVNIDFEGINVIANDLIPRVQPDVLAQRPVLVTGKWTPKTGGDAKDGVIRVSGQTGAGPWSADVRLSDAVDLGGHGTLALLWARERLWDLRDLHALRVDAPAQKTAIIELGLKYNLLTPFTSFVAVDMTPRISEAAAEQAKKVTQALPLPKGVSNLAVGVSELEADGVPTSPEPETIGLIIVAVLVAGVVLWRKRGQKAKGLV